MTDGPTGLRALARRAVLIATAAALLATAIPASASAFDYVAMGDSYSSGTGTRTYYEGCERSVFAYGYLIKGSLGSSFKHIACGGATTQDVLNNQLSSLDAGTKYVTISIGGNDAGFSSVITECAKPIVSCNSNITNAQNIINNTLPARLDNVYNQIRNRAPNAVVGVVGYPRLFNGEDCNALTFFSGDEETKLNQTADILASVTRTRAAAHGFTFIDVRGAFLGHAVCDNTEWLNGLSNPVGESYHPNTLGHSTGYAGPVRTALLAAPKPNAPVGGNGRIAFVSNRDGNNEVYAINADGQFPVNLTDDPSSDIDPEWSPDGKKLAFASNRDGDNEIYVMNDDGSGVTRLTNNTADDREPAWSPNGDYMTFRSNRDGDPEIFTMAANGSGVSQKTANTVDDFGPDWSRDGAELVWIRTSGNNEIYTSNADGQGQTNLTNNAANDARPSWGPSGNIVFHSNRTSNQFDIYTMTAIGGSVTRRTTSPARDEDPSWSPDGQKITFQSDRTSAGNLEVMTMNANGIDQFQRTTNAASDNSPVWQADSTPPSTTISAGPTGPTSSARPSFEFAASELGSSLQCKIDSGSFANCTSPYQTPELADGEHTLSVRSTDPAGNVGTTVAARTFVVDTVAPDVELTCPDSVLLNSDASATVVASDATSGLGAMDDPTGDHALDTSQPGAQTFSVHAIDLAGNRGEAECTYDVRYPDPGTPALTEGETPNTGAFTIGWTASAPAEYPIRYSVERRDADDDAWTEVRGGIDGTTLAFEGGDVADEGTWTYRVKGIDTENGVETGWSEASEAVKVDQTPPTAPTITADRAPEYAGDGGWFRDSVTVATTDNGDPDLRDGSAPSGVDPSSVAAPETLDASTTARRTVRDRVGNESAESELPLQVDTHAPSLELSCPASVVLRGDAAVTVTAADDQSGLAEDPSGTFAVDTSSPGTHVIERTATDNVGHSRTERCEVLVRYVYSGLQRPVDIASENEFKAGSTIPLKFDLRDADGRVVDDAEVEVLVQRTGDEPIAATSTNGKGVWYEADHYRFNLATKPLGPGTWTILIRLGDGVVHATQVTLR